jgi:NADPH-dependent 2,4-dienoyl-CoA reductase/sulfur reductase-like enzyme
VSERLVVVGGDAAGMSAASQARRLRDSDDLAITAFERGPFTSYSACGIPYFVGTAVDDLDALVMRSPEAFRRDYDIDARTGAEVVDIDLDRRAVRVRENGESPRWEGFDQLVVATGAVPKRPSLPGADARNVFGVQALEDGVAIAREMDERKPRRAVVVGGGYIGLEMAEAFMSRGLDVTLVTADEQPMRSLDADMGQLIAGAMRAIGITVLPNEEVEGFETSERRVAAVVTERRTLPADIVALGLGVAPNARLAEAAGISLGSAGGIVVDDHMHTRSDGVWAAGDCVEKWHRVARKHVVAALGTHANKEGRVAGINIGGGHASFPGIVGTAVSRVCDVEVGRTGLREEDATSLGLAAVGATVESTTRAGYFPEAAPIKIKMVAERGSGRLLGAQIVGKEGAAKRIDVLATALWNGMTVDALINVDLSYAPPFSPVWDPALIAARQAARRVAEVAED